MSDIINTARALQAVIQPTTGDRGTGTATFVATSADATLPRNTYLIPVISRKIRPDLVFKTGKGPEADESWLITSAGVQVDILSNVGGDQFNLNQGVQFLIDDPISGIEQYPTLDADITDGATLPSGTLGAVNSVAFYEDFGGPARSLDMFRSHVRKTPAVIFIWNGSEPADGTTIPQTTRTARVGGNSVLYQERYDVFIVTNRKDSGHLRRQEGLRIMDELTLLMTDRHSVDGICFSNPGGVQVLDRFRDSGQGQEFFQEFYLYGLSLGVMNAITRFDSRTYETLERIILTATTPDNGLPDQGPFPIVEDVEIDMTP